MKKNIFSTLSVATLALVLFYSCSKTVESKPAFLFKAAPDQSAGVKVGSQVISQSELFKGIEADLYDAEMKVFEIKMNTMKAKVVEILMDQDPKKKGLSNDEYLEKYVTNKITISNKQIDAFVAERKIPKEHLNDQMKSRIKQFLLIEEKKKAVDTWLAAKTKKTPVEIYFKKPERPVFAVNAGDSPFMGSADAKVTIVEFSDFQCPFCSKGATIMHEIKKKYGNKVKIVFKDFPLPFHNHAKLAAQAGLCVHEQDKGKFWTMHDKMFADQTKLDREGLVNSAKSLKIKMDQFTKCLDTGKYASKVEATMEEGKSVGVKSTPTFFVNGKMINGAHPVEVFSELIDQEMAK
ncbi:DsbA family protein [Halobacteriovorax sp. HLS]|uniref:DsbA family protein n=1 Tax=Halobacteriovorax sp. HLS TaxID=2234000 RepID=UPI000FDC3978|nr:DsbA family protein [Halobacteriovorax sp. HLS]